MLLYIISYWAIGATVFSVGCVRYGVELRERGDYWTSFVAVLLWPFLLVLMVSKDEEMRDR